MYRSQKKIWRILTLIKFVIHFWLTLQIKNIYAFFVDILMGITREELQQPSFAVMEMLQFPELHEESIAELAFHKHLLKG